MTTDAKKTSPAQHLRVVRETIGSIPDGLVFGIFLIAWLLLFHFLGNSNLGNVKTPSLFHWMDWVYHANEDDILGLYIPFVVIGLLWWKRDELAKVEPRRWWPSLLLVGLALAFHFVGFFIQQNRLSIVALYLGLWGFAGALWGPGLLRATLFPACLLVFCIPLTAVADTLTFPLRLLSTTITTFISQSLLGINVVRQGTFIFDESGKYSYEVAAACSGIRSLTAVFLLTTIYGFVVFQKTWKRATIILLGIPLVIISNVLRLLTIILAAEAFSQQAGNYVHDSTGMSLVPYVVAFAGILGAARLLKEDRDVDLVTAMIPVAVAVGLFAAPKMLWDSLQNDPVKGPPVFGAGSLVFIATVSILALATFVRSGASLATVRRSAWGVGAAGLALICAFLGVAVERSHSQKLSAPGVKVVPELVYAVSPTNKVLAGTNMVYLPENVPGYESKPLPLQYVVYDWLPKDTTYGQRRYVAPDQFFVDNMVVLMGTDRTSIHRPELCITGQGFRIISQTNAVVPMREPVAYNLPIRKIHFDGQVLDANGQKQHANGVFVYWFVSDDQVTADNEHRMSHAFRDFLRTGIVKRWAYVITMAFCAPGTEDATFERLQAFIRASVPEYQVTVGPQTAGGTAEAALR